MFVAADENGFLAESSGAILHTVLTTNSELVGREFLSFPRRGDHFFLNVYSKASEGGVVKLRQWKVMNPARKDYPVQIRKSAQTYEPLEVSEHEFRANIERDRVKRTH